MYNSLMGMGPKLATLSSQQLQHMGQQYKDDAIMLGLVLHEKQRRDAMEAASHGQQNQQPPVNEQVVQSLGPQQQQMPPPQQGQGPMPPQQGPQGPMPPQQGPQGPMPPQQGQGPMPPQRMADGGMTGLPEDSGIGALPAPNIARMAGGGIASFADDGLVKTAKAAAPSAETLAYLAETDRLAGLPPGTSARQIYTESGFNPDALGPMTRSGQASGAAQVVPETLKGLRKQMGNDKLDPTNPQDAMAMHRFLMQQNMARYKDPEKALRAYNSGTDTKRWDNPETNAYVSKILPKAPAAEQAEPGQIPGAMSKAQLKAEMDARAAQEKEQGKTWGDFGSQGKRLMGLGEAGLSMLTGAPGIQGLTYMPRTEEGQALLGSVAEKLEPFKIPAAMPVLGTPSRVAASASKTAQAIKAARAAEEAVKKAESASYFVKPTNVSPQGPIKPLPNVTSPAGPTQPRPYTVSPLDAAMESRMYKEGVSKAETAAEAAAREANAADQALRQGQSSNARANRVSQGANQTARVANVPANVTNEVGLAALAANRGANSISASDEPHLPGNMPDKAKDILADAAKKSVPAAERRSMGFTGDDWTMLGLQMLANPSPYFLQTVGKAGVATLANIQQQKQLEAERKYHGALGRKAEAEAGMYESGARVEKQIADEVEKDMANWLKTVEGQMSDATKQAEVKRRMYQEIAMRYPGYKPMATTGGAKFLGFEGTK
jgi:hypothetical protein